VNISEQRYLEESSARNSLECLQQFLFLHTLRHYDCRPQERSPSTDSMGRYLLGECALLTRPDGAAKCDSVLAWTKVPATARRGTMSSPSRHPILVVDDEPSIRESLALLLTSAGYDVSSAQDGFAALMHLKRRLPDLIVSDLNMPQMSGYELLSVIRRRFPEIVTVAMSGDYQGDVVPTGVIADAFFAKVQSPRNLLTRIAALLHRSESWVCTHQAVPQPGSPVTAMTLKECHTLW